MAKKYCTIGSPCQKEFIKLYDSIVGKYTRWEVWKDMVWMIAIAISNGVDSRFFDKREKLYLEIAGKYTRSEVEKFRQMWFLLVEDMDRRVTAGMHLCDFLGELFMNLDLGNELGGQFFTPYDVCYTMAKIEIGDGSHLKQTIEEHGFSSVHDCACGAGATLVAAAEAMREVGINYQRDVLFTAQDIDSTTALMCYIQLTLLGCPGYVRIGDTLSDPMTGEVLLGDYNDESMWYTPFFFAKVWDDRRSTFVMMHFINNLKERVKAACDEAELDTRTQEIATPPEAAQLAIVASKPTSPAPKRSAPQKPPQKRGKQLEGQMSLFDW